MTRNKYLFASWMSERSYSEESKMVRFSIPSNKDNRHDTKKLLANEKKFSLDAA